MFHSVFFRYIYDASTDTVRLFLGLSTVALPAINNSAIASAILNKALLPVVTPCTRLNNAIFPETPAFTLAAPITTNIDIKQNILESIIKKKNEVVDLEDELSKIKGIVDNDKERFMRFALNFVSNTGNKFLTIAPEYRLQCKQLLFPAGFYLDANNKVYTPEISPIYGLATTKRAPKRSIIPIWCT